MAPPARATRPPRHGLLAPLLLLLLAFSTGASATAGSPDMREFPKDSVFELDGVDYFYATGVMNTHTMVLGDGTAADALPFDGCAFLMLHPGSPNGRALVLGRFAGVTPMEMYVEDFRLEDGKPGYGAQVPVDAEGPTVEAVAHAAGNATLRVGGARYFDPMSSTGDPAVDRDLPKLAGSVLVSGEGLREDATGELLSRPAREDPELHVRIASPPGAPAAPASATFTSEASLPDGSALPTGAYGRYHFFNNLKFGGTATLGIDFQANAPPGMNELAFEVFSPQGIPLANATLSASALAPDEATLTVPLLEFGSYTIAVNGSIALGQYTISLREDPPPAFDLHLWWENVTYGRQAYDDFIACTKAIGTPNKVFAVDGVVGRPHPPRFNLAVVLVGVVGGVTIAVGSVKLLSDQMSLAAFRKSK